VTPISRSFSDDRNGWGATIIDSLSTMVSELLQLLPVWRLLTEALHSISWDLRFVVEIYACHMVV